MSVRILHGSAPATALLTALAARIRKLRPRLTIIQVGNDPRSTAYVRRKLDVCKKNGVHAALVHLPASATRAAVEKAIDHINTDRTVHGLLLQLPLPKALAQHAAALTARIDPRKDVDGLTAQNLGALLLGANGLQPATAAGVVRLLKHHKIAIKGKRIVVIGRSALVGKPLALLLLAEDATVTMCHSKTPNLPTITKQADILVSAAGKPKLVTKAMVKPGAVVIDVGITATDEGLTGDVDAGVRSIAGALTPVPGGVGPMTVAALIHNCVLAAERQRK